MCRRSERMDASDPSTPPRATPIAISVGE
jgi:hypothetical protein